MEYEREDQDRDEYNQGRTCFEQGKPMPANVSHIFRQGYLWQEKISRYTIYCLDCMVESKSSSRTRCLRCNGSDVTDMTEAVA